MIGKDFKESFRVNPIKSNSNTHIKYKSTQAVCATGQLPGPAAWKGSVHGKSQQIIQLVKGSIRLFNFFIRGCEYRGSAFDLNHVAGRVCINQSFPNKRGQLIIKGISNSTFCIGYIFYVWTFVSDPLSEMLRLNH